MTFGDWLKARRAAHKMTQKVLAERLDVSTVHLSRLENGHERPSARLLRAAVQVFENDPEGLQDIARWASERLLASHAAELLWAAVKEATALTFAACTDVTLPDGEALVALAMDCLLADRLAVVWQHDGDDWRDESVKTWRNGDPVPAGQTVLLVDLTNLRAAITAKTTPDDYNAALVKLGAIVPEDDEK